MPSEKRRRKKQGHRARLEAARAAARRAQRRRQAMTVAALLGLLAALFVGVSVFGHKDKAKATTDAATAAPYGTGECAPATKPATLPTSFAAAPRNCLKEGVTYRAAITTTEGVINADLDRSASPVAVNNFVNLARWGWFDGEGFHRISPGFVDQAGNAAGRGNPGYKIPDQLPSAVDAYTKGTLAMANAGPDTGGSQWFVCVDCSRLQTPAYAIFGHVSADSLGVVDAINALGTGDTTPPSKPVTITKVEILEG